MKKVMVLMVMMVMVASGAMSLMAEEVKAFDQCSGTVKVYTSEMEVKQKTVKVKESKLSSLRYIKKICKITDTYKGEDYTAYELDGGKGRFIKYKGGHKICLIVKDGELYGRWVELDQYGTALTCNLHDKRCHQRTHSETKGGWYYTYYFSMDALEHNAEILKARMQNLANVWGLTN